MAQAAGLTFDLGDDRGDPAVAVVDAGLGRANDAFAPLAGVRALTCFARLDGTVIGGAVGRTWGECCELQQRWVDETRRGRGVGSEVMRRFEAAARERGCRFFYLDTFSFQAPAFYRSLGYETVLKIEGYAEGVTKHTMAKRT